MRTEIVTEAWEFYRDNCPGFKEPMRKQLRKVDKYVAELESNNAKLRSFAQRLYTYAMDEYPDGTELNFADEARELGVCE